MQDLDIPDHMKELYKTVWEIKQKVRTYFHGPAVCTLCLSIKAGL